MTNRSRINTADEADPKTMPDRALMCAIEACKGSRHPSDEAFARACADELRRRPQVPRWVTSPAFAGVGTGAAA